MHDRLFAGAASHAESVVVPRATYGPRAVEASAVAARPVWADRQPRRGAAAAARHRCAALEPSTASASWIVYLAQQIGACRSRCCWARDRSNPVSATSAPTAPACDRRDGAYHTRAARAWPQSTRFARTILGDHIEPTFSAGMPRRDDRQPVLCRRPVPGTASGCGVSAAPSPTSRQSTRSRRRRSSTPRWPAWVRLSEDARAVAEAVALLEPSAELRLIAVLRHLLDLDVVAEAADGLLAIELFGSVAPCQFAGPILRTAVERRIGAGASAAVCTSRPRACSKAPISCQRGSPHMCSKPRRPGAASIMTALRQAAAQAIARGAPAGAAECLRRALAEQATAHVRRELLLDLGQAETPGPVAACRLAPPRGARPRRASRRGRHRGSVAGLCAGCTRAHWTRPWTHFGDVVERTDGSDSDAVLELEDALPPVDRRGGGQDQRDRRSRRVSGGAYCRSLPSAASAVHWTKIASGPLRAGAPPAGARARRSSPEFRCGAALKQALPACQPNRPRGCAWSGPTTSTAPCSCSPSSTQGAARTGQEAGVHRRCLLRTAGLRRPAAWRLSPTRRRTLSPSWPTRLTAESLGFTEFVAMIGRVPGAP